MENADKVKVKNDMYVETDEGSSDVEIVGEYMLSASHVKKAECEETVREHQCRPSAEYKHFFDAGRETFPRQSTQESHQSKHVPKHTATWTSQRNWGAGTSYEERNVPSVQGARRGTMNLGVRRRILKTRARLLNAAAKCITNSLVQHRKGGRKHNVAIMGDRRVGANHNVAIMGDGRVGMNHNVALIGDVITLSQKNEEKPEGTVHSAADETTYQNHGDVKKLQEFKETKSVSATGLKLKTEHKEHDYDDADFYFLQSLIPDMKKLSDRKKLKFKELVISSIGQLLEED